MTASEYRVAEIATGKHTILSKTFQRPQTRFVWKQTFLALREPGLIPSRQKSARISPTSRKCRANEGLCSRGSGNNGRS
jgi:transposase